jgi:integrase
MHFLFLSFVLGILCWICFFILVRGLLIAYDLDRKSLFIPSIESKNKRVIRIPLNKSAIIILNEQIGKHKNRVFTYKTKPVSYTNTTAWRKALDRAGIAPFKANNFQKDQPWAKKYPTRDLESYKYSAFRWHDLRHTWASWHALTGTPLQILKELGGWSSYKMVLRYTNLAPSQFSKFADNVDF